MEKEYWEDYYKRHYDVVEPSLFAKFVLEKHIKKGSSLIELGCGNGRDALYFANNNINVLAVDQCEEEIAYLIKNYKNDTLDFLAADFTHLGEIGMFDSIYSRFTLHSVVREDEDRTLKWAYNHLNCQGKLFIEVRGRGNELYKLGIAVANESDAFIYDKHYRRFLDFSELCIKLEQLGFKLLFADEAAGFAPFEELNEKFIRIVAVKG